MLFHVRNGQSLEVTALADQIQQLMRPSKRAGTDKFGDWMDIADQFERLKRGLMSKLGMRSNVDVTLDTDIQEKLDALKKCCAGESTHQIRSA